jgi:hypothetical protein
VPWKLATQSPADTDHLRIDRLTIYCGDHMLVPYTSKDGLDYGWLDTSSYYVFLGPAHIGVPNPRFCSPKMLMLALTLRERISPPQAGDDFAVIIICPLMLAATPADSPGRGRKVAYNVQQALQAVPNPHTGHLGPRIPLGTHIDIIAEFHIMSPTLFHELFHVTLNTLGSKCSIPASKCHGQHSVV